MEVFHAGLSRSPLVTAPSLCPEPLGSWQKLGGRSHKSMFVLSQSVGLSTEGIQHPLERTGQQLTYTSCTQTHVYDIKTHTMLARSSPQGCGLAQQLDRCWIRRTSSPWPSLPLPTDGALVLLC